MKVQVLPKQFKTGAGYDVRVTDETATVQDYLDAVNAYIDDGNLIRGENLTACKGCDGCCWERVPLTCIDVLNMQKSPAIQTALTGNKPALSEFLSKFAHVYVDGPAVDIAFGQKAHGSCLWLDETAGACQHYPFRPLVCQTFICAPSTRRAQELRSAVINHGMDELVRQAVLTAHTAGAPLVMHEACKPAVNPADWPENPFSGKTGYTQVLLRDLCNDKLWDDLRK